MHAERGANHARRNDGSEACGFAQAGIEAGALVQMTVDDADRQLSQCRCAMKQRIQTGAAIRHPLDKLFTAFTVKFCHGVLAVHGGSSAKNKGSRR